MVKAERTSDPQGWNAAKEVRNPNLLNGTELDTGIRAMAFGGGKFHPWSLLPRILCTRNSISCSEPSEQGYVQLDTHHGPGGPGTKAVGRPINEEGHSPSDKVQFLPPTKGGSKPRGEI